jgi:glycosyltransferase involved in cell wall biosynthesis
MRVLAFTRYGSQAASSRQRLLQYVPHLRAAGIDVEYYPLLPNDYVQAIAAGGHYPRWRIVRDYVRQLSRLVHKGQYDLLWVYADAFPYLPAWFERLVTGSGKPIVYDLDDAFFHHYDDNPDPLVLWILKDKFKKLFGSASACTFGNNYLKEYAAPFCGKSQVLPTVVDMSVYVPLADRPPGPLVIGWIGSPTTWPNVRPFLPLLARLCAEYGAQVHAVGAGPSAEQDLFPGLELIDWSEATEVAEIQHMDIGIMPLFDRPFERGKCGYKLIQYMACGLPVVASPVGVNREIVQDGANGFLATDESDWREALARLIADPEMRSRFGKAGRSIAEADYSLEIQAPRLIEILKDTAGNLASTTRPSGASPRPIR